ncbi:hypothetical protein [Caproiciproducens galactitolivorans]|uniref:Uncharacterized protein n=1 Tax=Caproiciproducens galactitolivorans TaxID=642589 RepID=A0ABT4BTY4_9FIRM|nr:hypothetical protein [Caproiciproducens galactitolivorans]MCY1713381.1 hypothetical protein [Caproiciproducens galactitolivorans]
MKNVSKKFVCLILTILMVSSFAIPCFAAEIKSSSDYQVVQDSGVKDSGVKDSGIFSLLSVSSNTKYNFPGGGVIRYPHDHGTIQVVSTVETFVASPVLFLTPKQAKNFYYSYLDSHAKTSVAKDVALFVAGLGAPHIPVVGSYLAGGLTMYAGIELSNEAAESFTVKRIKDCVDKGQGMEIYTEQVITGRNQGDGTFLSVNPWNGPYAESPASLTKPQTIIQLNGSDFPFSCDTTSTVPIKRGKKYTARITCGKYPSVVAGTGGIVSTKLKSRSGNDYYFSFTDIKAGKTGIYINNARAAVFTCSVS